MSFDPSKPFKRLDGPPSFDPNQPFQPVPMPNEGAGGMPPLDETHFLSLGRSALEGHTGGVSEPVISSLVAGAAVPQTLFTDESDTLSALRKTFQQDVESRKQAKAQHPGQHLAAEVAGSLVPSPLNVPARIFKGAQTLNRLAQTSKLPKAAKLAAPVVSGAGGMGALETVRQAALKPSGLIEGADSAEEVKNAALLGGGIPLAGKALSGLWNSGKWLGKAAFVSLFGVPKFSASQYLKNSEKINQVSSREDIKFRIDQAVGKIRDDFQSAKLSAEQAKEAFTQLKTDLQRQFAGEAYSAVEAEKQAQRALSEAYARTLEPLKAVPKPDFLVPRIHDAIGKLQDKISKGSSHAFDQLPKESSVNKGWLLKLIMTQHRSLPPAGAKDAAAIESLSQLHQRIEANYPDHIPIPRLKGIIQSLDRDIRWKAGPGQIMDPASKNKYLIRSQIDQALKTKYPTYRKAMEPVAQDSALLEEFNQNFGFGDERRLLAKLGSPTLLSQKGSLDVDVLKRLGQLTGTDLSTDIQKYKSAHGYLARDKQDQFLKKKLPEYEAHEKAKLQAKEKSSSYLNRKRLDEALEYSKENYDLNRAEQKLDAKKEALEPFKGLTDKTSNNYMSGVMRQGGNPYYRETLKKLGDSLGHDFIEEIQNRHVRDSFYKRNVQGSRNVNLFRSLFGAVLGGGAGIALSKDDFPLGDAGKAGAMGAGAGAIMDNFGPQIGKAVLDTVIALKAHPSVKLIRKAKLPTQVKLELENAFKYYLLKEAEGQGLFNDEAVPTPKPNAKLNARIKALDDDED